MEIKLNNIILSVIEHSTEDENKVLQSLCYFIPEKIDDENININSIETEGCFGNPIIIHEIELTKKNAKLTYKHIMNLLKRNERNVSKLKKDIDTRLEKGKIYLRFNKQLAYNNKCVLIDGDDIIRIVIGFNVYGTKNKEEEVKKHILNEINNLDIKLLKNKQNIK